MELDDDKGCITGLSLGLGIGSGYVPKTKKQKVNKPVPCQDLTFELFPEGENIHVNHDGKEEGFSLNLQQPNANNNSGDNTNKKNSCRKKLRLTKEQSTMLEETFKVQITLTPDQRQALADRLNLRNRQVEVWFQNRRARTKLKQTEVDCEFLKKCCEQLTDENRRLKKELQQLRALEVVAPSPLYINKLSKASTFAICSSCEKPLKPNDKKNSDVKNGLKL